jgi:hypothetical protein
MHTTRTSVILLTFLAGFFLLSTINIKAQEEPFNDDTTINVGIYIISISNFEFTKGTYILDFYLMFQWENSNIP